MKQSKFDLVMDYIDENIHEHTETIKRGIVNLIGINSNSFGQYFTVVTEGDTLGSYIRSRRLYYAAKELQEYPQKPICDIALDYGYSDQSSFTRAFTATYGFSPNELRHKHRSHLLKNNKYHFEDFISQAEDSRSHLIWREFERTGLIFDSNIQFIESAENGSEEFGFDIDTCYAIADLSERLEVPAYALMRAIFDSVAEIKKNPSYLANDEMAAIQLGVHSYEDLQKICEYYACMYYELNCFMVDGYYCSNP
jgi:AraC-like DNA-binding protein